ncbi:putative laccase-9 [Vitis vinifera]|uniref:Putative laccase-9 n=1 Tax=Vitis vinifera TaxID=29760 RepID=A0A438JDU4_VITVI|nr:putative laccase-9 [Vitis vinifera]
MWLIMKVFLLQILAFLVFGGGIHCQASTRRLTFVVREASYTRLCSAKNILTVNGQFPGPTIYAMKGETIIVDVYNRGKENVTIHWHGVTMPRYPWTDGPEYITQCPIQPGSKFTQKIILSTEEGTLWWHAQVTGPEPLHIQANGGSWKDLSTSHNQCCLARGSLLAIAKHKMTVVMAGLRSLANAEHPCNVPLSTSTKLFYTLSMNSYPCVNDSCAGPNGTRFSSSINNISFHTPTVDILEAYYYNISGVYGNNFPSFPPLVFDFTYDYLPLIYQLPSSGTEVRVLEYNSTVEMFFKGQPCLQRHTTLCISMDTVSMLGCNRFKASNPGVWFFHCHVERHVTWGMETAFIVKNGKHPEAQMLPPPSDMPPC